MHLHISANSKEAVDKAKGLAENLAQHIKSEYEKHTAHRPPTTASAQPPPPYPPPPSVYPPGYP